MTHDQLVEKVAEKIYEVDIVSPLNDWNDVRKGSCAYVTYTNLANSILSLIAEATAGKKYPSVSDMGPSKDEIDFCEGFNYKDTEIQRLLKGDSNGTI